MSLNAPPALSERFGHSAICPAPTGRSARRRAAPEGGFANKARAVRVFMRPPKAELFWKFRYSPIPSKGLCPRLRFPSLGTAASTSVWMTIVNLLRSSRTSRLIAKKFGMKILIHNHTQEFEFLEGGKPRPYDILIAETDPVLVALQLDIGWASVAGQKIVGMFKKSPGRFELWH